jgi:SNF2 family DNA or RNA helicase
MAYPNWCAGSSAQFLTRAGRRNRDSRPGADRACSGHQRQINSTFLYLESAASPQRANDEQIHLGHRAVMNLVPYQLDPALQALRSRASRILIADAVGLGKTLEAGILTTELIQRGRGKRILVVTQKSMLTQFQKECWSRFTIPLVRLDSVGLQRVRNSIPSQSQPVQLLRPHPSSRSIRSRTISNTATISENAWWDIIIIDECHNVAARATKLACRGVPDWLVCCPVVRTP